MEQIKKTELMYNLLMTAVPLDQKKLFQDTFNTCFEIVDERFTVIKTKQNEWKSYLHALDTLNEEGTLLALKVVISLLYRDSILHRNEEMREILLCKQAMFFSTKNVPRKERIDFGIKIFREWPRDIGSQFQHHFTHPIEKLFIEEAKDDPQYILEKFDSLDKNKHRSFIFNFLEHRPLGMLEFARILKDERPLLFLNALSSFLKYYNTDWSNQKDVDTDKIKQVSFELYSIIVENQYPENMDIEKNLQMLMHHAYMEESWYTNLCERLWAIESKKNQMDKESLKNYFLIAINCEENTKLVNEVHERFALWGESYKTFDVANYKLFIDFIDHINELFNKSLNNVFADMRNVTLPTTIERKILNDLVALCWNMTEWVYQRDKKLYFIVLKKLAHLDYTSEKISRRVVLAKQAAEIFIVRFDPFVKEDIESATDIVGHLLKGSSHCAETKCMINMILDQVFFMLEDIAPQNAKAELDKVVAEENEFYQHYDRGGPSY